MEISQYDEYIPEKGLDTNFKIPRKRTAEDSFGSQAADAYAEYYAQAAKAVQAAQAQVQYGHYAPPPPQAQASYSQAQLAAGAASQASAYTNSKPPVQYQVPSPAKIETNRPPPLPPDYHQTTTAVTSMMRQETPPTPTIPNAATPVYSTAVTLSASLNKPPPVQNRNTYPTGNNMSTQKGATNVNLGGANVNLGGANANQGGAMNRSWGGATNRNWTGVQSNSNASNNSNNNSNWRGGANSRSWSGGRGGGGLFNKEPADGNRNWNDSFGQESDTAAMGGTRSWGGNSNQNWSGNNNNNNRSWNVEGGDSWRNTSSNDDEYGDSFGNVAESGFSGGRGRFSGRGGWNNRSGNSFGGERDLENDYGDQDNGRNNQGFGNRQSWDKQGFNNDSGFGNNRGRGFGRGRGRAGHNRDGRGAGNVHEGGEGINMHEGRGGGRGNRRGNFRGRSGRGGGFGRNFGSKEGDEGGNSRPFQNKDRVKPKTETRPVVIEDLNDESLPKELREMFLPLQCKLCEIEMSSNIMAKVHYKSKNHEKKIRKFLIEHAEKTGESLHPRALVTANASKQEKEKEVEENPRYFHCTICDLPLTGKLHAESHYMGKNHNAVVMGKRQPTGRGRYDENGKWVRLIAETKIILGEGEDNFGLAFRKKPEQAQDAAEVGPPALEKPSSTSFTCSLCNVSCTCQEQINMHFNGAKHKKKLKLLGVSPENFEVPKEGATSGGEAVAVTVSEDASAILDPNEAIAVERNDFSKYKTPSGYFYCGTCNMTLNSEVQLKQHLTSKNHIKNAGKKAEPQEEQKMVEQ